MKIFLISDNHAWHDEAILKHARQADEVWHAGDWLNLDLYNELEKSGIPVRSCWGNVDGHEIRAIFPEHNRFTLENMDIWITHIAGYPGKYHPALRPALLSNPPDILICGHSHILRVMRDEKLKNMLYINPGSCGIQGFHHVRTGVSFELSAGRISNMQVIEFGPRVQKLG